MVKLNDLEWMISVVKTAMDYGTLNYTSDEYDRLKRLYKEIYDEELK